MGRRVRGRMLRRGVRLLRSWRRLLLRVGRGLMGCLSSRCIASKVILWLSFGTLYKPGFTVMLLVGKLAQTEAYVRSHILVGESA